MTDLERWQSSNDRYLAAAMRLLRLRLEQAAPAEATSPETPDARRSRQRRRETQLETPRRELSDGRLSEAAEALADAEGAVPPPAALLLSERLGLSAFERAVLLLCAAMELDTRIPQLCAAAQDDPGRPYPTFALALALFDDPAWDVRSPERPLRYWQLVDAPDHDAEPLTVRPLRADERVVNYLKGLNHLDERLSPLLQPLAPAAGDTPLPPSQVAVTATIARRIAAVGGGAAPALQLTGPFASSKRLVAGHVAADLGLALYRLPAELLPTQPQHLDQLARLWTREALLSPLALYVEEADAASDAPQQLSALRRFIARAGGVVFVDVREPVTDLGNARFVFSVAKPAPAEQRTTWEEALGSVAGDLPAAVAGQFDLESDQIRRIAMDARAEDAADRRVLRDRVWDGCRAATRPRMETLAERIDAKATWRDLVLPEDETTTLRHLTDQVAQRWRVYDEWGYRERMNRGLGITALFAGDSGTGKTMAAEVIASELRLDLYRIDLSAVVDKYIGETEKNLRRLFDAAEDGGALLFFDEADALFGKRSEVRDSHDRYANIEINYLLQRMEAYRGLAILATNARAALDVAFLRRLRFVVTLPYPDVALRRRIWERVFPDRVPLGALDLDRLARFELTGGNIHNAALNAAFIAAREGTDVTMPAVLHAIRDEFRKVERPVSDREFRWDAPEGAVA